MQGNATHYAAKGFAHALGVFFGSLIALVAAIGVLPLTIMYHIWAWAVVHGFVWEWWVNPLSGWTQPTLGQFVGLNASLMILRSLFQKKLAGGTTIDEDNKDKWKYELFYALSLPWAALAVSWTLHLVWQPTRYTF